MWPTWAESADPSGRRGHPRGRAAGFKGWHGIRSPSGNMPLKPFRRYLATRRGQLARLTLDPRSWAGLDGTPRWTIAVPIGVYRSRAAGWRIARLAVSIRRVPRRGWEVCVERERW